ncbi:MAG: ribonuclease Y [Verrucomicrobia bacterium]|nr:MAG: ribonuclease Y [Verrucomicrobiota bacterium]
MVWIIGILGGLLLGSIVSWLATLHLRRRAREEAARVIELGRREAEIEKQKLINEATREADQIRADARAEATRAELETESRLREIRSHEESLARLDHELTVQEQKLERERAAVLQAREAVRGMSKNVRKTMESLAGMGVDEVRESLREEVRRECEEELRKLRQSLLDRSEQEIEREARELLVSTMQRLTTRSLNDLTATIVSLPNDDMKGRIIGREGRNIKCFEAATGTTLLIDESPQMVLISSFDPVRRQVARIALEGLVADGRIHPASIEEFVANAEKEVEASVRSAGEEAVAKVKITAVHPEVIQLLGRLRFRFSFTQNALDHSIEVGLLAGMIASEMGLDPEPARRAGLFHDIGKSMDAEYEGSHATAGAEFLKRHGESAIVVNAVAAHHEEVPAESIYAGIVVLADTISAVRPGARAESLGAYIERLERLEKLALSFEGVKSAFAVHAGREVRVLVSPEKVDDAGARVLARDLRRRIEDELQYPSTIKITVIREQRYTETAT